MVQRPHCVDCGDHAPEMNHDDTLVSSTGWRLERRTQGRSILILWRCPGCWKQHRARSSMGTKGTR